MKNLLPHNGEVCYFENLFSEGESTRLFENLMEQVNWKQEPIKIYGKEIMQPRLTAWFADEGVSYSYSGITMKATAWNSKLREIKQRVEGVAGVCFNSALLNLYRNGNDSMGWHRDNERELGSRPPIASVSFGAMRKFQMRTHVGKSHLITIYPASGSCLLMRGETQIYWEHRVPKMSALQGQRLNITFRKVIGFLDQPS